MGASCIRFGLERAPGNSWRFDGNEVKVKGKRSAEATAVMQGEGTAGGGEAGAGARQDEDGPAVTVPCGHRRGRTLSSRATSS